MHNHIIELVSLNYYFVCSVVTFLLYLKLSHRERERESDNAHVYTERQIINFTKIIIAFGTIFFVVLIRKQYSNVRNIRLLSLILELHLPQKCSSNYNYITVQLYRHTGCLMMTYKTPMYM